MIYYAWSRLSETTAPLEVIENRFPTLFEGRRMLYPRFTEFADPERFDQGIGGFLDHFQRPSFVAFAQHAANVVGVPVTEVERADTDGAQTSITRDLLCDVDTLIVISLDSMRTGQQAREDELTTLKEFLDGPGNLLVVAPHHNIGDDPGAEFLHHGDRLIPPQQRFSAFARSILTGLNVPVENRFGLRPATLSDGEPAPIECESDLDRLGLLEGVTTFTSHPHLPHFERCGAATEKLDVLARQRVDRRAPPHPFIADGRASFDSLLQSRDGVFRGDLLVGDATLFTSTWRGVASLTRLWSNLLKRASPASAATAGPDMRWAMPTMPS